MGLADTHKANGLINGMSHDNYKGSQNIPERSPGDSDRDIVGYRELSLDQFNYSVKNEVVVTKAVVSIG